jgi:hypothetical protein
MDRDEELLFEDFLKPSLGPEEDHFSVLPGLDIPSELDTDFLKHLEAEHLVWKETLTSPAPLNKPSLPPSTTTTTKKRRASVACYWCHKSKTSCGEERPCLRCVRLGLQDSCIDRPHKKRGRPAVKLEICKDEACFDPKPSDFLMFDDQLSLTSSSSPGAPPKDLPEAVRESLVSLFRDLYFQESNCSLDDTSSGELRAWYSKLYGCMFDSRAHVLN